VPHQTSHLIDWSIVIVKGADELVPVDGKDEVYDSIMATIGELERELDEQLKKFEKSLGYMLHAISHAGADLTSQMFAQLLA